MWIELVMDVSHYWCFFGSVWLVVNTCENGVSYRFLQTILDRNMPIHSILIASDICPKDDLAWSSLYQKYRITYMSSRIPTDKRVCNASCNRMTRCIQLIQVQYVLQQFCRSVCLPVAVMPEYCVETTEHTHLSFWWTRTNGDNALLQWHIVLQEGSLLK